jgi:mono/diheme cytochrome c family protein
VEIDGDKFHSVMPPHPDLTDQQIADLLTYVRNSFGNKASAVRVSEVKAARAKLK